MSTTKKSKINLKHYRNLNRGLNSRTKYDYIDYDYLSKLSEEDLEYLNKFSGEYYSGDFRKEEGAIRGDGKYLEDNLHKTKEERKECYTRNNKRNVDYISVGKAKGEAIFPENLADYIDESICDDRNNFEEVMIAILDNKRNKV